MRRFRFIVVLAVLFWVSRHLDVALPVTHWLGDQVDQIQAGIHLFHGHLQYLYGPYMSGTNPAVHTIGPLGSIIFAVPIIFGQTPDVAHIFNVLILSGALTIFIAAIWDQMGLIAAVAAGAVILAAKVFWWIIGLYWAAGLPLICALVHAAVFVATVPRWRAGFIWSHLAVFFVGLHFHAVYLVTLPVLIYALILNQGHWRRSFFSLRREWLPKIILGVAITPYILAEIIFKFRNSKAILAHLKQKSGSDYSAGWRGLHDVAEFYQSGIVEAFGLDKISWLSFQNLWALIGPVAFMGLYRFFRHKNKSWTNVCLFFLPLMMLWHAAFFLKMNRPLQGEHYLAMGLPFVTLWIVCVMHELAKLSWPLSAGAKLGIIAYLWVAVIPKSARTVEQTPWTWNALQLALAGACDKYGAEGFQTFEGPGFQTYTPELDPVLRFTLKHWDVGCRYNASSKVALRPDITGDLPASFNNDKEKWNLVETLTPAIGIYKIEQ